MRVKELVDAIRKRTKTSINETEAKALLNEYGVPVVQEVVAKDGQEAVNAADIFGYPVVVKGLIDVLKYLVFWRIFLLCNPHKLFHDLSPV